MKRVAHRDAMIQVDFIASRHQKAAVNPGWGRYAQLTYSPAVRAGEMLFIAGHTALDPETAMPMHAGNVAAQAAFVYENILRVVAAAGGGPSISQRPSNTSRRVRSSAIARSPACARASCPRPFRPPPDACARPCCVRSIRSKSTRLR
jgi:enamine deaminase RidA (YjgF/YER057c/UK114 family)